MDMLAIDIGYSQVKMVDEKGEKYLFSSFVEREYVDPNKSVNDDPSIITIGDEFFRAKETSRASLNMSPDYHGSTEWHALMGKAFYEYAKDNDLGTEFKMPSLGIGLPIGQRTRAKVEELESIKRFEFSAGKTPYVVEFEKVYCFPQGAVMLQNVGYDEDECIGLIDIGYKTLDLMVLDGCEVVPEFTKSIDKGAFLVIQNARKVCEDKFARGFTDRSILKLLSTKQIFVNKKTWKMGTEITPILEGFWKDVLREVQAVWGDEIELMHRVVIGGGGALLLEGQVKNGLPRTSTVPAADPVFGNALGYITSMQSLRG